MTNKERLEKLDSLRLDMFLSNGLQNTFDRYEKTSYIIDILLGVELSIGRLLTPEETLRAVYVVVNMFDYYMDIYLYGAVKKLVRELGVGRR